MVKHIILWQFKPELTDIEKAGVKNGIKRGLEALKGQIEGLIDIKVVIDMLQTSNCDAMLEATFTDFAALKNYANNPLHLEVANKKVRPYLENRVCIDYEI